MFVLSFFFHLNKCGCLPDIFPKACLVEFFGETLFFLLQILKGRISLLVAIIYCFTGEFYLNLSNVCLVIVLCKFDQF